MIPARGYLIPALVALVLVLLGSPVRSETGMASFYGGRAHHGKPMANGQRFDQNSDSCAHKKHPFGSVLLVSTARGRVVTCVVRDRGPFVRGRVVDLSHAGARAIGLMGVGIARVTVERIK